MIWQSHLERIGKSFRCVCFVALWFTGCAGELENPERFLDENMQPASPVQEPEMASPEPSTPAPEPIPSEPDTPEPNPSPEPEQPPGPVVCEPLGLTGEQLLATRCGTQFCHSTMFMSAGLDLESPELAARLVEQPALGCEGQLLLNTANPDESYLWNKVNPEPVCGSTMPLDADPLSADEAQCLRAWIERTANSQGN